ncbi:MAG: outer membrane protein assembly factor BamA [Candidatus Omnitrophica bacterium]|nr:outer membrane protein assembly factor BamA [Candidatus Omnitrophota bacterium]
MKIRASWFFFVVPLLITVSCWAQEPSSENRYPSPYRKVIKEITIAGAKTVSIPSIEAHMKLKAGAVLDEQAVGEDIKRLYATGYFTDVRIDVQDLPDNFVRLAVTVEEKKVLREIVIKGNRHLREKNIREAMGLAVGDFMSQRQLVEDIKRVKELYESKGYPYSEIATELTEYPDTNEVGLTIVIYERAKRRIKEISFEGNSAFSEKQLRKLLKTKRDTLFTSGYLKEAALESDMDRIRAFYQREGFMDVQVSWELTEGKKEGEVILTIHIAEGKQYHVGTVSVQGTVLFPSTELYKLFELGSGDIFSREAVQKDIGKLQAFYYDRGYIFAEIRVSTAFDPATENIDITYAITENEIAYVNKINIRGNQKTKDIVIRRELRINPGDQFDGSKIARSKERLYNLGFFEEVSFDTVETDETAKQDLVVSVKEAKTGELSFGAGFSSIDKVIGFVELAQHNFDIGNWKTFTGDGQDLKLRASIGTVRRDMLLSFTEPWIFDHPVLFGVDLYNKTLLRESDIGVGFDEERRGGDMRLGKEFLEYLRGDLMYRLDRVVISNVSEEASADLKDEAGTNYISSINSRLTYDKTDSRFNPTKGHVLVGSWEIAGGFIGGDKEYSKYYGSASQYFSLKEKHILELKLRLGAVHAFGDSETVPVYERFFAGGTNSIRGYEERRVGPRDSRSNDPLGGEGMLIANAEYTFPTVIDVLKGAVFFDVGNVWGKMKDFGTDEYRMGVGAGIRIKTPVGPVRLDYGFPLNPQEEDEDSKGRFHFSLSKGF